MNRPSGLVNVSQSAGTLGAAVGVGAVPSVGAAVGAVVGVVEVAANSSSSPPQAANRNRALATPARINLMALFSSRSLAAAFHSRS